MTDSKLLPGFIHADFPHPLRHCFAGIRENLGSKCRVMSRDFLCDFHMPLWKKKEVCHCDCDSNASDSIQKLLLQTITQIAFSDDLHHTLPLRRLCHR